ncbi:down syndrome cell adhesion molecule-like protein Dscam2 [Caerostris darwini]|uniref:Down syndrome cell adhesion molecule-like protein Dscam2 n=1 Tax=Caerostris darwini TaxID=1538125 RepID=A0AAV4NQ23_9ARAC|nr:down syndrome cell adhesion molecule-like protein Dscam2 [Caerostris darwini]
MKIECCQRSGNVLLKIKMFCNKSLLALAQNENCAHSFRGPSFTKEPPNKIVFHNSSGAIVPCHVTGVPQPTVQWTKSDWTRLPNIPGLRHSRQDGSLVFQPFRAEEYRQDIHGAVYRCIATNSFGSIGSTEVHVRGGTAMFFIMFI